MLLDTKTICRLLQNANRPKLAKILGEVWETPLLDYADQLWEKPVAPPPFEIELRESLILPGMNEIRRSVESR